MAPHSTFQAIRAKVRHRSELDKPTEEMFIRGRERRRDKKMASHILHLYGEFLFMDTHYAINFNPF